MSYKVFIFITVATVVSARAPSPISGLPTATYNSQYTVPNEIIRKHPGSPSVAYAVTPSVTRTTNHLETLDHPENEGAPPQYEFGYSISDPVTGDVKEHQESRLGDQVRGRYSFIEADGRKRIVEYTADDIHGFIAVVRYEPAGGISRLAETAQAEARAPVHQRPPARLSVSSLPYSSYQ